MLISAGSIVRSLSGHDEGDLFFVITTQNDMAVIANGKQRRIEKPKHKKLKHLRFVCDGACSTAQKLKAGQEVTNNELRKALAVFTAQHCGV